MPTELSMLIQDWCRPAYRHPSKEHKKITERLIIEIQWMIAGVNFHREEMEEMEEEDTWNTSQHLLAEQGWEIWEHDERPYRNPELWSHRKRELAAIGVGVSEGVQAMLKKIEMEM